MWYEEPLEAPKLSKAVKADMTPVEVNPETGVGVFMGRHKSDMNPYIVTLDFCPCGSFKSDKRPCKHMYRLALELGLIPDVPFKSDKAKIPIPDKVKREIGLPLEDLVARVETCSVNAQLTIKEALRAVSKRAEACVSADNPCFPELMRAGLIGDNTALLPECRLNAPGLYSYLLRKYDEYTYSKPGVVPFNYPAGALVRECEEFVDPETGAVYNAYCEYIEAEYAELLDKYGYNRCNPPLRLYIEHCE